MPVLAVVSSLDSADGFSPSSEALAMLDDAYWWRYVRRPFTWQRYLNWWVARRWVMPREKWRR